VLISPKALLLDFGGVIVTSGRGSSAEIVPKVARRVWELIGGVLSEDEIVSELKRADELRDELRKESTDCVELSFARLWGELVADLWPEQAREAVVARAAELTYLWTRRASWRLMPGMAEVLDYTLQEGLPVVVVSNTRCGEAHRDALDSFGVTGAFAMQIYSDELGLYKPNPQMILAATSALDIPPGQCWMVGDTVHRDVECARRAKAGAAILMADKPEPAARKAADATVKDGHELLALLQSAG
jgi:phosphoglycolate phosphatase-like HAD superfamily hydrolase